MERHIFLMKKIAVVGSFNFDPRSSFLNTESLVTINSPEFVELIQQEIDKQIVNSLKVGEDYSYISNNIKETTNLHPFKKIAIKAISKLVYFFRISFVRIYFLILDIKGI